VTRAEAARQAITETAEQDRRRSGLAPEARALMGDPDYGGRSPVNVASDKHGIGFARAAFTNRWAGSGCAPYGGIVMLLLGLGLLGPVARPRSDLSQHDPQGQQHDR